MCMHEQSGHVYARAIEYAKCSQLAESHPPFWAMFRLSESNGKLVSLLPSKRNFAEGNWAGGEAFACVPTFRNGHAGEARRCERKVPLLQQHCHKSHPILDDVMVS